METARGIILNLQDSNYSFEKYGITFYFSSKFYLEKYKREYLSYITTENMKLEIKYKCPINLQKYLAISFYKKLEKRGFRIIINEKEFTNVPLFEVIV